MGVELPLWIILQWHLTIGGVFHLVEVGVGVGMRHYVEGVRVQCMDEYIISEEMS